MTWKSKFGEVCIYPTPLHGQIVTQGQFLSRVKLVWRQSFPFPRLIALSKLKNLICLFTHSWGRTDGFMPFARALVKSEKQAALSRVWNRVADSISYDNYYYTKHAL